MVLRKDELEAKLKDEHQLISSGVLREENPLDNSDAFSDFLEACRRGDLKRCQELINAGVNINGKDNFDYTPLIVASLCGHFELVRLLLEQGALAERNTFQGERCIYNALNDRIRNLLLSYDYSKSADPLQPWASHITSLLTRERPNTSDIALVSGSESFQLHKFLLSSRTPYFQQKLADAPETKTWRLAHSVPFQAFHLVLRYLYLGDLPRDLVDPRTSTTEEEVFRGIDKISKQLEVKQLWDAVLSLDDRRLARQRYQDEVARARDQVEAFFRDKVLGHKMVVETGKVGEVRWRHDNFIFADCLVRADDEEEEEEEADGPGGADADAETAQRHVDGVIPVGPADGERLEVERRRLPRSVVFPVHKAMLIRSPYFETMFSGDFREALAAEHLHMIKVDCTPEVLEIILTFLYTDRADCPLDAALDLLYAADMLFLDKLKAKAATVISTLGSGGGNALVDRTHHPGGGGGGDAHAAAEEVVAEAEQEEEEPINVYDVIRAAWDLRVQRLEEFAARYMASRLEDYIDEAEFADVIRESASRIRRREETDTIELLDDIRYYLSERFRLRFEEAGLEELLDEDDGGGLDDADAATTADGGGEAAAPVAPAPAAVSVVRTLDGELVGDEFESDALNYKILLGKIDTLLERLKLDA